MPEKETMVTLKSKPTNTLCMILGKWLTPESVLIFRVNGDRQIQSLIKWYIQYPQQRIWIRLFSCFSFSFLLWKMNDLYHISFTFLNCFLFYEQLSEPLIFTTSLLSTIDLNCSWVRFNQLSFCFQLLCFLLFLAKEEQLFSAPPFMLRFYIRDGTGIFSPVNCFLLLSSLKLY